MNKQEDSVKMYLVEESVVVDCMKIIESSFRDYNYATLEEQLDACGFPATYYTLLHTLKEDI